MINRIRKYVIVILVVVVMLIFIVSCDSNSDSTEMNLKIAELQENIELLENENSQLQNKLEKNENSSNTPVIESLTEDSKAEEQTYSYRVTEFQHLFGLYQFSGESSIYSLPSYESRPLELTQPSIVEIYSVVENELHEKWALINHFNNASRSVDAFGYVPIETLEKMEDKYDEYSKLQVMEEFVLGESLNDINLFEDQPAIIVNGFDGGYVHYFDNYDEQIFNQVLDEKGNVVSYVLENGLEVSVDKYSNVAYALRVYSDKYELLSGLKVGQNAYEAISICDNLYVRDGEKYENSELEYVTYDTEVGYFLALIFETNDVTEEIIVKRIAIYPNMSE